MQTSIQLFWVFLGGGCGAALRHTLVSAGTRLFALQAPWAILLVNLLGCLCIGLLADALLRTGNPQWRLLLISGFLGGFTTYSTFILDLLNFGQRHHGAALLYGGLHLAGGILCCLAGIRLGRLLFS